MHAKPFLCRRNTFSYELLRIKTRFDTEAKGTRKWPIKLTVESVKDTDKFRLDCWRTERRGLLVPVLKNNSNDVVSNVAFALHLIQKTQPYYYSWKPRPVTERKGKLKSVSTSIHTAGQQKKVS